MQTTTTVGLDIAKSVFQVHGVDAQGNVVVRRQLKRRYVLAFFQKLPPCVVGIEACASSHYWSRELQALGDTCRLSLSGTAVRARCERGLARSAAPQSGRCDRLMAMSGWTDAKMVRTDTHAGQAASGAAKSLSHYLSLGRKYEVGSIPTKRQTIKKT